MTKIAKDNNVVTLINVFAVKPEHHQHLVDVLASRGNRSGDEKPAGLWFCELRP